MAARMCVWALATCMLSCHPPFCQFPIPATRSHRQAGDSLSRKACCSRAGRNSESDADKKRLEDLIRRRLPQLISRSGKPQPSCLDPNRFPRLFSDVLERERRQLGPTKDAWDELVNACRQALGSDVLLLQIGSYLKRTSAKSAGSDLDIRLQSQRATRTFCDADKEKLRSHLQELDFVRGPGGQGPVEIGPYDNAQDVGITQIRRGIRDRWTWRSQPPRST
eukprot:TRINITY_DN19357_c0_g1_i2.p1 TRINITY_DN19357_c0_g1~~TRINITY_DN19357_c0_g1_i2.p1  ORF type:complete len:246 (+),score=14.10 TRINITY_DN19357_c0_g1_i2:73-738(+)